MKKILTAAMTLVMVIMLVACTGTPASSTTSQSSSETGSTTESTTEEVATTETTVEPGSAGKIAVIRLLANSDHTAQFFAGCVAEGEALGYTVDTFTADQDDVTMQDMMEQALGKDYNIWIISHANEGYQYDIISKAVAKGIYVVGFDCGGEHVPGVTYTSQDDVMLAKLSLDGMIEATKALGATEPIKFAEINILGLIVPFDTRHSVIEQYEAEGKMEVAEIISPDLTGDVYSQIYTAVTTVLNNNPGPFGVWAASSGLLDGAMAAIDDAGRTDVIATAIDISNLELSRMVEKPYYYSCAAVDPFIIGVVDVRLAVLKQLGVETPETYALEAVNIFGSQITAEDTMLTLGKTFKDFGTTEAFNTDEIKAQREKYMP